jgi:hypothetical protein
MLITEIITYYLLFNVKPLIPSVRVCNVEIIVLSRCSVYLCAVLVTLFVSKMYCDIG